MQSELERFHKPIAHVVEIGEAMYSHDPNKPKVLTPYVIFRDMTDGGNLFIMRSTMVMSGIHALNEVYFNSNKAVEDNDFGLKPNDVYNDKIVQETKSLYSKLMIVSITFKGIPKGKKYHQIDIQVYDNNK